MASTTEERAYIVLNGEVIVVVAPSKRILCEETFKHFTELRWAKQRTSPDFSLASVVSDILTKLSLPHELIPIGEGNLSSMQLWEDAHASMPATTKNPLASKRTGDEELPID